MGERGLWELVAEARLHRLRGSSLREEQEALIKFCYTACNPGDPPRAQAESFLESYGAEILLMRSIGDEHQKVIAASSPLGVCELTASLNVSEFDEEDDESAKWRGIREVISGAIKIVKSATGRGQLTPIPSV